MEVSPDELLFTQDSIAVRFKVPREKERIDDAVDSLLQGKVQMTDFPRLRVVSYEGRLWSLDNRRLWVFKKAKVRRIVVDLVPYKKNSRFAELMVNSPELKIRLLQRGYWPPVRGKCRKVFLNQAGIPAGQPTAPPTPLPSVDVRQPYSRENRPQRPLLSRSDDHAGPNEFKRLLDENRKKRATTEPSRKSMALVGLAITVLVLLVADCRKAVVNMLSRVVKVTFGKIIPTVGSWALRTIWRLTSGDDRFSDGECRDHTWKIAIQIHKNVRLEEFLRI